MRDGKMRLLSALRCSIAALVFWSFPLAAEDDQALYRSLVQYAAGGKRVIDSKVLPLLERTAPYEDRAIMANIDWRYPAVNSLIAGAFIDPSGTRVVEISGGFIRLIDSVVDAAVLAEKFEKNDRVADFFLDITDTIRFNADAKSRGNPERTLATFDEYAPLPKDAVLEYKRSETYQFKRTLYFNNALAFIVAHEIGHHIADDVKTHWKTLAESREREAKADAYAMARLQAAGFTPLAVASVMGLIASKEGDPTSISGEGDHPPTVCRQTEFVTNGVASLLASGDFEEKLSHKPEWGAQADFYRAYIPSLKRFDNLCCKGNIWNDARCSSKGQASVGYCIPLYVALHTVDFAIFKNGNEQEIGDTKRWRSNFKLLHVGGCHLDARKNRVRLVCEQGYMDDKTEWQAAYDNHVTAIRNCAAYVDTRWKIESDSNGENDENFYPADDHVGHASVDKVADSLGRMFVRVTVWPRSD